jgi:hypothetical protein
MAELTEVVPRSITAAPATATIFFRVFMVVPPRGMQVCTVERGPA